MKIRNEIQKIILSIILVLGMFFCSLGFDPDITVPGAERGADSAAISASSGLFTEVISDEHSQAGLLKVFFSRNTRSRRGFGLRQISFAASALSLILLLLICLLQSGYFKTVIFSRLFIITYIHNLDGLKS